MGEPVLIADLARRMIELSGLTVRDEANPEGDIELSITGLRPGEKLYEELLIGDDSEATEHPRIMKAHEDFLSWPELSKRLKALNFALDRNDMPTARGMLAELVSGYSSTDEVADLAFSGTETNTAA
jgi:FlaA1/EpsC-like NDP-sugar epimerase